MSASASPPSTLRNVDDPATDGRFIVDMMRKCSLGRWHRQCNRVLAREVFLEPNGPTDGERLYARASRVATFPLGLSIERRTIWGRKIAPGAGSLREARPELGSVLGSVLVLGGIHGDEPASTEAVIELAERLLGRPREDGEIWLVPALNPDGLVRDQKNNARDVDLNRNFPARNFTATYPPGYCPGPAPLSEPETAMLAQLVKSENVHAVVAVHAPFACVNFDGPASSWAGIVSAACGWPVRESIGYPTPGSLGTWLGVDRGMPVLTLELPRGALDGFRAAAAAALDTAIASAPL